MPIGDCGSEKSHPISTINQSINFNGLESCEDEMNEFNTVVRDSI
jgi:hypothetical protein